MHDRDIRRFIRTNVSYLQRIGDFSTRLNGRCLHTVSFHQSVAFCRESDLKISGGWRRFVAIDHGLMAVVGCVRIIDRIQFSMVQQSGETGGKLYRCSGGDVDLQRISNSQIGQQPFLLVADGFCRRHGKRLCEDSIWKRIAQQGRSEYFSASIVCHQAVLKGFAAFDDRHDLSLIGFTTVRNGGDADSAICARVKDDFKAVGQADAFRYFWIQCAVEKFRKRVGNQ